MATLKSFDITVNNRARASKTFRCAILKSAINELLNGELKVANILLNHYLNAVIDLQHDTQDNKPTILQAYLHQKSNLSMHELITLLREIQRVEGVRIKTKIYNK